MTDSKTEADLELSKSEITTGWPLNAMRAALVPWGSMLRYLARDLMRYFSVLYVEAVSLDESITKITLAAYLASGSCGKMFICLCH